MKKHYKKQDNNIKLTSIRRSLSFACMTIWLSNRYVVLKRQYIKKRISLDKERSFFYFFFFSVGWLCLAKLDESSKFGCFLPALLLLPFPICNAPPLILTIPYKKILLHPGGFFYCLLLIIPNCSRSTSNTPGSSIPFWIVLKP